MCAPPCATRCRWWVDRAERSDRAHFLISLQRRFPLPPPQLHQPTLEPWTRQGRGTAVFPVRTRGLIQCIIYDRNFSNLSIGYGSRFEEWADRSSQSGGSRRRGSRWLRGAKEGFRSRGEMFEEQVASRGSGDACKLSAVCGNAFTSRPVRLGRRG